MSFFRNYILVIIVLTILSAIAGYFIISDWLAGYGSTIGIIVGIGYSLLATYWNREIIKSGYEMHSTGEFYDMEYSSILLALIKDVLSTKEKNPFDDFIGRMFWTIFLQWFFKLLIILVFLPGVIICFIQTRLFDLLDHFHKRSLLK